MDTSTRLTLNTIKVILTGLETNWDSMTEVMRANALAAIAFESEKMHRRIRVTRWDKDIKGLNVSLE